MSSPKNRETWLEQAVRALKPLFTKQAGIDLPPVRVSVGWPGGRGNKDTTIGQCWAGIAASDGVAQIFVSPVIDDGLRALDVLTHELIHATLPAGSGHSKVFVTPMRAMGLEGKPTATHAGDTLKSQLVPILAKLGSYPHAALSKEQIGGKKQTTRMLKAECAEDSGYVVRLTAKWLSEYGPPICPCHELVMVEA